MTARKGASAPGKLMVSGEYAVLEGSVAVVASAGARVSALWSPDGIDRSVSRSDDSSQSRPLPPEAALTRRLAEHRVGKVESALVIDVTDLRKSGRKLGLGSSAAASAAVAGAVFAEAGRDLTDPAIRRQVFEIALEGHRAVAPKGSGADVAAASLGGFVRFRLEDGKLADASPLDWPSGVRTRVVWTGVEARTNEFLDQVHAYEQRDGAGYSRVRTRLDQGASAFVDRLQASDAAGLVAAAGAYGEAMAELGERAGIPIVSEELAQVARLARQHGGSAKPSGAGGGDVALAFFDSAQAASDFDAACNEQGLDVLDLQLGVDGVSPACRDTSEGQLPD